MVLNKVYAAAADDEDGVTLASTEDGTQPSSRPPLLKKLSVKSASRKPKEPFHRRLQRNLLKEYNKLSWSTRQTISVAISLFAVLYAFVSVPFRIGFLYNPFDATNEERRQWTWELAVFTPMDVVTDLIGVLEFVNFYRLWRNALTHKEKETNFDKDAKLMRGISKRLRNTNVLLRARSSVGLRQGKAKWTLSNIGRTTTLYDSTSDDLMLEKQSRAARKWEFALEIIALIPVELIPLALGLYDLLHVARLNKLCRFYKVRRCFARLSKIYSDRPWVQHLSSTGIRSLVRTIGYCAGACHWVACGYMFIAHAQCGVSLHHCDPEIETSWVVRDRLHGATVSRKYGRTLYWASRTMVLLGYDDVTPVSNGETIYGIFVQLVGALFSSSMLATFLFIFRFRNARYAAYSAHVDNAREYMHSNNIPRVIRHKVMAYFAYTWDTHHGLDSEEALHLMPKHLQSKVVATLKASRIRQVSFLAKESVEFINLLALALERRIYSPTDRIIEPRTTAHMFFVIRGNVMITPVNGNPRECFNGDYFAEVCLLFPEQYMEKAVARTFCELYVLAKAKFDDVVTHFYRGNESAVLAQMTESFDRYTTQQRKTQKVLGNDGRDRSSLRMSYRRTSDVYIPGMGPKNINWNFPDSNFRMIWDTLRLLGVIYVAFEVPYYAVFVSMADGENMFVETSFITLRYVCTLLIEVFFGVDIVLQARFLAYLDPVAMLNVENPSLIFAAYRENGFYWDLLAWLPVGLILESVPSGADYAWFLRLLRLSRLRLFPYLLRELFDVYSLSSKIHLFISLLLSVTLLLHVVGCGWFETAWIPRDTQSFSDKSMATMHELTRPECLRQATLYGNCSWIKFDCYGNVGEVFPVEDSASSYEGTFAYVRAVYWSVITLTAVGYGDIVAFSTAESYFAAIWIFIGGMINFGVVGAMSSTIANAMAARHHHLELLNTLNSIMGRLSISEKLSAEIRRFYIHHFTGRKVAYESQLLSHLPDQLCYQISSLLHAEAVKSVRLFDSASRKFLQQITGKFRHRTYENGETIFLEGDVCREFIVLLRGSKVNVFFRTRKVPARALQEGDCYGIHEFLLRRAHAATLTAASTVHASVMTRVEFDVIQRKFDEDVRNLKLEAQMLWDEQQTCLRRVVRNLERLKLKPHVLQTPSLFYQPDTVVESATTSSSSTRKTSSTAIRDSYATRTTFIHAWNAGVTFWNVYNAFFVIFRVGFHSHLHFSSELNLVVWFMDLCGDIYFAMDIYLHLYFFGCTDVSVNNLLHRKWVDRVYRRSTAFKWDLVASLPLYVPFSSDSLIVSVCRLPRLIRCLDLWVYLDEVIVQVQQHFASRNVSAYLGPVKLMIVLVLVAHFVGCIFLWISEHECEYYENCWMAHDHLLHEYHHALPVLYSKTFYWAITTLLLVGSREMVPRDILGTIWTLITCLGCTFAMGYIVGEISELILDLGKETKKYKNRIANFESFAQANELPESLRERIGFFFRVQFESTHGHDLDHTVHKLSANLRLRLMLEIYGGSLARLPITHFLSSAQINNMALRLQSELYIPGDNILVEGTLGNHLCTLRKGLAAAFWTKSVSSVAVIMEGALFGEAAFFLPDQRRLVTVRATTTCEVLYISRHDWEELWAPTGDQSDYKVQKYELHSILDWVSNRLHRYQQRCIHVARKAKHELAVPTLARMRRCKSLPSFGNKFFESVREEEANRLMVEDVWTVGADIDFETIKRCQRPQYESQLRLYHQYRMWKGLDMVEKPAAQTSIDAQLIFQRSLRAEATDRKTKEFIKLVKRMGKVWDAIMLLVAVYHVMITPFKLCFPHELTELDAGTLRAWAGFEIFLDMLCLFDVAHKVNEASFASHSSGTKVTKSKRLRLRHVLETNASLVVDIVAVLPLELLLLAGSVRVSLEHEVAGEVDSNWWTTRWILRMNRMLFAWRIESLSEGILQYLIYDCDVDVSEAFISFLRALASYLTMAHFLACLWFATSYYGLHQYGTSWLSTSGMLTYIAPLVPLGRKYLRSLHFSMECITTLFYGDILSMNRLELMVEIAITLWAIYIYGALVGAQGELLDSSARREASFEQNLAELQLYLVQNDVPKILKRHIKAYYAHIWHRSHGDKDFAIIEGTSRSLHEDVVVATLQDFAVRVEVFRALDEPFLRALLVCLQYVVCSQGEDVVVAGDVDRSMYFIATGRIRVQIGDTDTPRGRGQFFGELSLLYGVSRLETSVAMTVAELYRLDHEPYERVLVDFPEYRVRNKLAWSTSASTSFDRQVLEKSVQAMKKQGPNTIIPINMRAIAAEEEANRVEAEVPRSYVFLSTMEMLARLHEVDPLEAKDLIIKCRTGARRHVKKLQHRVTLNTIEAAVKMLTDKPKGDKHEDLVQHISLRPVKHLQPLKDERRRRSFENLLVENLEEDAQPPGLLTSHD
ncbi:hypothetical protein PHYSODRAFT_532063 [Phytophthora sojae]|uniref:Cyclic nucleotide-binding domain-containing protein n=1 Tax=Phytophthora sojae (strain P6497) TaxID=1094619 RepID=G5ADV8_PHYSP|nr:hypothetical protein PHYSODRAFT_532063 [Phytophthora sojae]EGZ06360.1 hypothetical protein PHYSODRAFT_532063 [Phytophthora sojae]|eukprot:XP_009538257.1 hypothetical protein PHYSODRAFT_532063 [Phytophthora sojae]